MQEFSGKPICINLVLEQQRNRFFHNQVEGFPPPMDVRRGNVGIVEAMADFMHEYGKT